MEHPLVARAVGEALPSGFGIDVEAIHVRITVKDQKGRHKAIVVAHGHDMANGHGWGRCRPVRPPAALSVTSLISMAVTASAVKQSPWHEGRVVFDEVADGRASAGAALGSATSVAAVATFALRRRSELR